MSDPSTTTAFFLVPGLASACGILSLALAWAAWQRSSRLSIPLIVKLKRSGK
ncbi:MAG: hypothetical protein SFV51_30415 [Bryobacteraceae bacterium]|nr:hypothetical protein [Bryobacteraceae bacterium]